MIKAMVFRSLLLLAVLACRPAAAGARDLDEVKASGVLRHLGVPYAYFVTGSGDGMDVEIMRLFAAKLGVKYEFVPTEWDTCIGDLTGRQARLKAGDAERGQETPVRGDVIASGMTVLPWRAKVMAFSAPTFKNQVWLVARAESKLMPIKPSRSVEKDIAAVKKMLRDKALLCKANTCLDPTLYDLGTTGAELRLFAGPLNAMVPALLKKEAEVTLLDAPDAFVALENWPGKIKVLGPVSAVQDMAAAFRKDSPRLREAFDAFLADLKKSGAFRAIVEKYYPYVREYDPAFLQGL
ncbi:MAG: ABC transporter substrate-binding protein [Nitrospiraceae bacterium]|nr:ABC transporter substrate-binding protein [Nitrospiraceae bacterium]